MRLIEFPILSSRSGSEVYVKRLVDSLKTHPYKCIVKEYPLIYEPIPFMIPYIPCRATDIIHANADYGGFLSRHNIPLVTTVHHIDHGVLQKSYFRNIGQEMIRSLKLRFVYNSLTKASSVIAVSYYTKEIIQTIYGFSDISVIHNGINTNMFKPIIVHNFFEKKIKILFVGNPSFRKGFDIAVKAIKSLGDNYLLLVVPGLKGKIQNPNEKMIIFQKPPEHELIKIYNMADIVLVPSRLEGFGYVAVEGMACGKPIVASNCSSLPELIEHEKGGFLCPPNDLRKFIDCIEYLASDESARFAMGAFNRKRAVERFEASKMAEKYDAIYRKL